MPALVTTRASPSGSLSLVSTLPWIGFGAVSSVTEAESGLASGGRLSVFPLIVMVSFAQSVPPCPSEML